ncbi:MAG: nicotinate phosphoribosyltransferase [Bacteroidales bacterium]|nr:nicotinate phosphoribosyltransferase [Bacteroidales bacterium]
MSWLINGKSTKDEKEVMRAFNLKYAPMVKSLIDTDLYKFSMGQVYHHQWASDHAIWDFKARNVGEGLTHGKYDHADCEEIINQLKAYCALQFDTDELSFMNERFPWIQDNYTNFLSFWHPKFEDFEITESGISGIEIHFSGVQEYISYYEIPLLEITAETYYRNHYDYEELLLKFKTETKEKIDKIKRGEYDLGVFSEFGARRRLSYEAQEHVVKALKESGIKGFMGTSNVYLAMKYDLNAAGTMAHEFIMSVGQGHPEYNPAYSNKYALESWVKEYSTWNGTALTDTITTNCFLKDFQRTFSNLFSGVRHDSGDPYEWGDKMIAHYKSFGIDPMTKTLLFSDGLNGEIASSINRYFKGKAKVAFGIGTWWSAPQGIKPLNIVAKTALINGSDVAKLSDADGKNMCRNPEYIDYLKRTIEWRMKH